jgi:hypothetical protein
MNQQTNEKLTVELMCITWEYRSMFMSFSTLTEPGLQTYIISLYLIHDCGHKMKIYRKNYAGSEKYTALTVTTKQLTNKLARVESWVLWDLAKVSIINC